MKEYQKCAKEMMDFIDRSPSCFHAVENIGKKLEEAGFLRLREADAWDLKNGQGYFVTRNDSSVIAFFLPKNKAKSFHITAAHSDSPTFKIKDNPEIAVEEHYIRLNTEKYGGMILSTWLDRPLSVAGRVALRGADGRIETKLVNVDKDLLVIPNLAIHMNRDINSKMEYNAQVDMLPLFADFHTSKKNAFLKVIAKAAGVKAENILGHDLFLYTRQKGIFIGEDNEFLMSPRLDDLQCAFSTVKAFASSVPKEAINVCAVFDNEEVGSGTRQGADSTFLEDTLVRIAEGLGLSRSAYLALLAESFLISADNAHAVHPNHPEKADPTHRPYLNGGIVLKFHGAQKYTTDGISAARLRSLCENAQVTCQTFTNRSDMMGGSTLGNISTAHVSILSADIGLPQLAMHSAVETAGAKDTYDCVKMLQVFFAE